eukprot:302273_1
MSKSPGEVSRSLAFEIQDQSSQYTFVCRGGCALPEVAADPRGVFMRRVKTRRAGANVRLKYIMDEDLYEFGPLLISKDPEQRDSKAARKLNSETFRFSNSGPYPLKFALEWENGARGVYTAPPEDESGGSASDTDIFFLETTSLELDIEETKTVTVWAFPQAEGDYINALICSVKDNPNVSRFRVHCKGCKPSIELSETSLTFERLLLKQSSSQRVEVRNTSLIPAQWALKGVEELGNEFQVSVSDGTI